MATTKAFELAQLSANVTSTTGLSTLATGIVSSEKIGAGIAVPLGNIHSKSAINHLLILESEDAHSDIISIDTGGSTRIRSTSGAFTFWTGGDANTQATNASQILTIADDGIINVASTASSTGSSTGALMVAGGVGVGENLYVGGVINTSNTTTSTNTSTGALIVGGGAGIGENLNVAGNVVVTGDLTVEGSTVTLNTTTLDVEDKNITLNYHVSSDTSASADGAGITIQDAVDASNDASILWNATNDEFDFSHAITVPGTLTLTSNAPRIFLYEADTTDLNTALFSSGGKFTIRTTTDNDATRTTRLEVDHNNGNITFYDSAGDAGLVWDAGEGTDGALLIGGHTDLRAGSVAGRNDAQLSLESTNYHNATFVENQNTANGYHLVLGKTRGTAVNAVTIVQAEDEIGSLTFAAADGTDIRPKVASVSAHVPAGTTPTTNAVSGELRFGTTSQAQDTTTHMVLNKDGRLGIGTLLPETLLDVQNSSTALYTSNMSGLGSYVPSSSDMIQVRNTHTGLDDIYAGIWFETGTGATNTTGTDRAGRIALVVDNDSAYSSNFVFQTRSADAQLTEKMRITQNGNVGIGTTAPDALLHVSATSPHIDIGPQGGNRGKIGYHDLDVIIGSTSSTGEIIFKNNISSADSPQTSGDTKLVIHDVGMTLYSDTYNILNVATDTNDDETSTDGIIKITNGSSYTTKAELRWDESEDLVHVSYGDHGRHVSINSTGKVGIGTGSTSPTETLDVAGTALVENAKLKAIAKDLGDTAIDLFVYDTRKDSDGGAWRKRTQNTSWYKETLNTATRGSRREFPTIAVVVVRAGQVITIYDGDDPDMPMWMVFNGSNLIYGTVTPGIEILNGIMFFTGNVSCSEVNFITEFMGLHQGSSISQTKGAWSNGIINRNNTAGNWTTEKAGRGSVIKSGTLVNQATNDVAMKVLPNAPINNDTGLAVPTIALATDAGISVIDDSGFVRNIISNNSSYNYWDTVKFTKDNKLIIQANYQNVTNQLTHIVDVPTGNVSASNVNSRYAALNGRYYHGDSCSPRLSVSSYKPKVAALEKNNIAIGHRQDHFGGINLIAEEPSTQSGQTSNSAMAYINSVYNTGWFVGNTKIAALSSTDSTNISSSGNTNILAGKTWTNNASFPYETFTTSGLDITSAINTTAYGAANLTWISTPGKTYTVHFNMTLNSGNMPRCFMQTSSSFGNGLEHTPVSGANSFTFTATSSGSIYFSFSTNNGDPSNYSVSGLELYEGGDGNHYMNPLAVQDHIGLSAIGTVTKTVVATGADLMGYSGFSASNFLEQPYVSGLNAGTGGYSVTFWVKNDGTNGTVACRGTADSDESMRIYMNDSNYGIYFDYGVGAPYCYLTTPTDRALANNGYWHQVVVHVSANGPGHIYLDGKKMSVTVAGNAISTIPNDTDYKLRIGASYGSAGSALAPMTNGSIALFRYSLTIPTDEQIARIYNDEKHLFQENAKSVIIGTSNTVSALAYDEDTKLLHVGSSWGRSVFRGLSRVEEHLNYVPQVAISATGGIVAEE